MSFTIFALFALLTLASNGVSGQQGNEDTLFAVAFGHSSYSMAVDAEIVISTKQTSQVTISWSDGSDSFTVNAFQTYYYAVDASWRVDHGIETKAFIIESDQPVSVQYFSTTYAGARIPDAVLARPADYNFWVTSFKDHVECNRKPMSFYMITATEDNTLVNHGGVEVTLDKFEVLTVDAFEELGIVDRWRVDYSGTYITGDKPISVYSGHGCAVVNMQPAWLNQYFLESMPGPLHRGKKFVTFRYNFGHPDAGYWFSVTTTEPDTRVTIPATGDDDLIADAGGVMYYDFDVVTDISFVIECDKNCQVAQYTKESNNLGNEGIDSGGLMAMLTDGDFMSDSLSFSVSSLNTEQTHNRLSIVVDSDDARGLYLNGVSLNNIDWVAVNGDMSMSAATIQLDSVINYHLYTWDTNKLFTAYFHQCDVAGSPICYGSPVGYGESGFATTTTTTTTTTPAPTTTISQGTTEDPWAHREPPRYELKVQTNFYSGNGLNFTTGCNSLHNNNLRDQATTMIQYFNAWIGVTMCTHVNNGDITVISASSAFVAEGHDGSCQASWTLKNTNHLMLKDVYDCGDEIIYYMTDLNNWPQIPVFPPISGCAQPILDPQNFFDGTNGYEWRCTGIDLMEDDTAITELTLDTKNNKNYEDVMNINVTKNHPRHVNDYWDNFTTFNDEAMSQLCLAEYRQSWSEQVEMMRVYLWDLFNEGTVCPHTHTRMDMGDITTSDITLAPGDINGNILSSFYLKPINETIIFNEVYQCADELYYWVKNHTSWPNYPPLIPHEVGCARMNFTPPQPAEMYEGAQYWYCLEYVETVGAEMVENAGSVFSSWAEWIKNLIA